MKLKYKIIIGVLLFYIIVGFLIYLGYRNWRNGFSNPLEIQMYKSQVLEQKIGKVKKIRNKVFSYPKAINKKEGILKYIIKTSKGKYEVTTVFAMVNMNFVVEKYIIDGEEIYEIKN